MTQPIGPAEGEALRRLIAKWRDEAVKWQRGIGDNQNTRLFTECADELEAALAPLSGPVDASGEPMDRCTCGHVRETHHVWGKCHGEYYAEAGSRLCKCTAFVLREIVDLPAAAVPSSPAQELTMTTSTGVTLTVERYNDLLEGERGMWATLKAHGKLVAALMKIRDNATDEPASRQIARDALATDLREIDWSAVDAAALPPSSPVADSPTWQPIESVVWDEDSPFVLAAWPSGNGYDVGEVVRERGGWMDFTGHQVQPEFWMALPSFPSAPEKNS